MTYSRIFAFVVIASCTTTAMADVTLPRLMLAAADHDRDYRGNGANPRQYDEPADNGRGQRQRQEAMPQRERHEGFGYGFERRQERSARPDDGRRGRN